MVLSLLKNPIFLTILFTGIGAQVLKFIIYSIKYKTPHPLDLVATGGMPSSHSALTVGMSAIIYLTEGLTSAFFVMLALTFIVLVDAMGVRRTAGEEGKIIHQLIRKTKLRLTEPHYSLGHTPSQVAVGAVLGFMTAIMIYIMM